MQGFRFRFSGAHISVSSNYSPLPFTGDAIFVTKLAKEIDENIANIFYFIHCNITIT